MSVKKGICIYIHYYLSSNTQLLRKKQTWLWWSTLKFNQILMQNYNIKGVSYGQIFSFAGLVIYLLTGMMNFWVSFCACSCNGGSCDSTQYSTQDLLLEVAGLDLSTGSLQTTWHVDDRLANGTVQHSIYNLTIGKEAMDYAETYNITVNGMHLSRALTIPLTILLPMDHLMTTELLSPSRMNFLCHTVASCRNTWKYWESW